MAPNYEGKGAVTGRICRDLDDTGKHVVNVRVGGPNAGHTVLGHCPPSCESSPDGDGHAVAEHPWRLRQVPVAAVTCPEASLVIAAGSEIDPTVLQQELSDLDAAGYNATDRLMIDRSATVLEPHHIDAEALADLNVKLGSTAKGIGAARAERIWRTATTWGQYVTDDMSFDTTAYLHRALRGNDAVVVEGTQGYGLGLHTEQYPFVTSGDCRAVDFLSQAGVSPWALQCVQHDLKVVVCLRPHPIRVAGNSGRLLGETSWAKLGLPAERTTVTQRIRRVGGWDAVMARAAVAANGGPREGVVWAALTMMDSVDPALSGDDSIRRQLHTVEAAKPFLDSIGLSTRDLGYVGTGPSTALVNERMYY